MKKETIKLFCKDSYEEKKQVELTYEILEKECKIYYENSEYSGNTIYDCLKDMRSVHFDGTGTKILCNGTRKNFVLSGMSAQMGRGFKGYIVKLGESATPPLVNIFDFCDKVDEIVSVEEQERFREEWFNSF